MIGNDEDNGGWSQWRQLVLSELRRLNAGLEKSNERYLLMQQDVTRLKVWSAVWGAAGGIAATLLFQKIIFG